MSHQTDTPYQPIPMPRHTHLMQRGSPTPVRILKTFCRCNLVASLPPTAGEPSQQKHSTDYLFGVGVGVLFLFNNFGPPGEGVGVGLLLGSVEIPLRPVPGFGVAVGL